MRPFIRDLATFFENPFLAPRIPIDRLKRFAEDHLARLTAHPIPGTTGADLLTQTGARYTTYFGAITNEDLAETMRTGLTLAVDNKLEQFKALVKKRKQTIEGVFVDEPEVVKQFFPRGLEEYTKAGKEEVGTLMARMVELATGNTGPSALKPAVAAEFAALQSEYGTLRSAQLQKKGDVADSEDAREAGRLAIADQLWANLHYIAFYFRGDVERCNSYFDQSMLRGGAAGGDDEEDDPAVPDTDPASI